jgi:hypothetical protein
MGNVQEELDEIDATGTETVDPRVGIAAAVVLAGASVL